MQIPPNTRGMEKMKQIDCAACYPQLVGISETWPGRVYTCLFMCCWGLKKKKEQIFWVNV